jgi:hypothetical protein
MIWFIHSFIVVLKNTDVFFQEDGDVAEHT